MPHLIRGWDEDNPGTGDESISLYDVLYIDCSIRVY